jgi:hypothetical protein
MPHAECPITAAQLNGHALVQSAANVIFFANSAEKQSVRAAKLSV